MAHSFKRIPPAEAYNDMRIWQWRGKKKRERIEVIQYNSGCFVVSKNGKDISCKYQSLSELEHLENIDLIRKFKQQDEVDSKMALKLSEVNNPDVKLSANMTWVETDDGSNKGIFAGYDENDQPQFVWQIQNGNKVNMADMKAQIKAMLENGHTSKTPGNVSKSNGKQSNEENSNMNFQVPSFGNVGGNVATPTQTQPVNVPAQTQPVNTNNVTQFTQNPQVKRTKERKRAATTETVEVTFDSQGSNYVVNYKFRNDENSPWQDNKFNIPAGAVSPSALPQYVMHAMRDVFTKLVRNVDGNINDADVRQSKVNAIADKFRQVNEGSKLVETRGTGTSGKRGGEGGGRVKRTNIYAAALAATFQGMTIGDANKKWDAMTEQQRTNVMNFPAFAAKLKELQGGAAGAVAQDELTALLG